LIEQVRALDPDTTSEPDDLYVQARALALDRTDLVVRRMLIQKMRLLAARENEQPPSDEVLSAYYARHAAAYRSPERVTLWHVFLSSGAAEHAAALLAELRRDAVPPALAARRGNTFSAPPHLRAQSATDLARYFGATFSEALALLPTATWAGPIASSHGVHLVWIERRTPGDVPPLGDIRGQIRERWLDEHRTQRLEDLLRALKVRYPMQIESAAWLERNST
jgi:parvulin-like peptidyl-prolyl isomerase